MEKEGLTLTFGVEYPSDKVYNLLKKCYKMKDKISDKTLNKLHKSSKSIIKEFTAI